MLKSMASVFRPALGATFWPHSGLSRSQYQDNLDYGGCSGDQANISQPKQVSIESKFVEIKPK